MNVTFAAYGPRVTELLRDGFNGAHDVAFGLNLGIELLYFSQSDGGQHRPGPSSKVLGGEIQTSYLAQIFIHVAGINALPLAVVIDVLEKLLARKFLAALDDFRQPPVIEIKLKFHAALAAKCEMNFCSSDFDMFGAHGGQSERAVLLRILLIAHSDQCRFEELYDRCNYFDAREIGARPVSGDARAHFR